MTRGGCSEMGEQVASDIGSRVRFYRLTGRKTQTVIAGLAGITTDHLYQIERGKKTPTLAVLLALADALGVEPGSLLDGSERAQHGPPTPSVPFADALHRAMLLPTFDREASTGGNTSAKSSTPRGLKTNLTPSPKPSTVCRITFAAARCLQTRRSPTHAALPTASPQTTQCSAAEDATTTGPAAPSAAPLASHGTAAQGQVARRGVAVVSCDPLAC